MNIIQPKIFSDSSKITAVFTEANRESGLQNTSIKGLDFGINTSTADSIRTKYLRNLLIHIGVKTDSIALAHQVHGSNVKIVNKPGIYKNTDGLITKTKGLSIGIQVADCAAVLAADEINGVIGAFHAGWRGAVSNILSAGLDKMKSIGAQPDNLKAYISPCISVEMFEVGEEVAEQFSDSFIDRSGYPKPHVNLKGYLIHQMTEAGMNRDKIEVSPECTMQNERFFSYRREREKAGRMLGLINLNTK